MKIQLDLLSQLSTPQYDTKARGCVQDGRSVEAGRGSKDGRGAKNGQSAKGGRGSPL